jgi:DNA polymerase
VIEPDVLVLLGATAAQSIFGPQFRITQERGVVRQGPLAKAVVATLHPSAVLRAPDADARRDLFQTLVGDLRLVAKLLEEKQGK